MGLNIAGATMSFMKNDVVMHADMPQLGIGKVLEHAMGDKVRIFFLTVGEKKFDTNFARLVKVEGDQAHHPLLDNLKIPERGKKIEYRRMEELIQAFLALAPDGFQDQQYQDKFRSKKLELHQQIVEWFEKERLQSQLDDKQYNDICRQALEVVDKINLVAPTEKKALKVALADEANQAKFAKKLYALLYQDADLRVRFNQFATCLHRIEAAKWTIQTFFLFMVYPDKYLFMKPTTTRNAAAAFSFDLKYKKELNWRSYRNLLAFGKYVADELEKAGGNLQPQDMIDVQSFMWSIAQGRLV